jgi:MoaA/NifB/PqqE/SkfB family radical SAM enzyme
VNKLNYTGPKVYQEKNITLKLIERIQEAAGDGINIRYLDNSGSGECTLHPDFGERMNLFGDMLRKWNAKIAPPKVSIVTNGYNLLKKNILEKLSDNQIELRISFPTAISEHYGTIMRQDAREGKTLLANVVPAIGKAMEMAAQKKIPRLDFHISPPYYHMYEDFPQTIEFLTSLAAQNRLSEINLEMFPALTNRGGKVEITQNRVETYPTFFKTYNRKFLNGVKINMYLSTKRYFLTFYDYLDILYSFRYPCLYFANIFLSPFGDSCCCNDQAVKEKFGNITENSIKEIMKIKANALPKICEKCSHSLDKDSYLGFLPIYHFWAKIKGALTK